MAKTCEKCGSGFPSTIKIDGKWKVLNKRKYCLICSPWNQHNTRKLKTNTKEEKFCPRCETKKSINDFYVRRTRTDPSAYCIPCSKEECISRLKSVKKQCVEYKGGKCQCCGYADCLEAMEFHHTDRLTKKFNISSVKGRLKWDVIKQELDKCVLVCCRCHREIEAGIRPCPEICLCSATG